MDLPQQTVQFCRFLLQDAAADALSLWGALDAHTLAALAGAPHQSAVLVTKPIDARFVCFGTHGTQLHVL